MELIDSTLRFDSNDGRSYIQQLESPNNESYNKINGHSWEEADVYYRQDRSVPGLGLNINDGWENRANGGETWHIHFD